MAMSEELGLATSAQNQYDGIKDWYECDEFWFSLGVCSSRKPTIEGQREYGEQTLATPSFQR